MIPPPARRRRSAGAALLVAVVLQLTFAPGGAVPASDADEETGSPPLDASAVAGGVARLPCDISPPLHQDAVYLVIWYKDGALSPVYSLDARGRPLHQARHWADEKALSGRAFFRYMDRPARLTIESARESDGGRYRCRVDFKSSPTRNTRVNLSIIVPPEKVVILDDKGFHVPNRVLGPYDEDASPDIVCIVTGGRPPPKVTWWRDGLLLDDSYEALPGGRARNLLRLERLQRSHADSQLTCQASNNELVAPASASVTIDLNLEPLWVRLLGEARPLSADASQEVQCEVVGARPTPSVTWWLADAQLRNTREATSRDRNVTISTVTFVPSLEDAGKTLACRAGSADNTQEDSWTLDILHVPIVNLELGSNINSSHIREGMDVYFDCSIKSNPWVYRVSWRHNGKPLGNNATAGTIVSNQSLVLQSVSRARAGIYTCVASNQEGDGESNPVYLDIKYAPACRAGQQSVLTVARHQTARVVCLVDANPQRVQFSWRFNNSAELVDVPPSHIASDRTRSVASYVPATALDYGTLLCSGRNELGPQKAPCVFQVVPAGKPDPPVNCTVANQTSESVQVECAQGSGGGLPQLFVMEVVDAASGELLANTTSPAPTLSAGGLPHGAGLNLSLYSANSKGRSDASTLTVAAVRPQETRTGPEVRPQPPTKCSLARRTATSVMVSCDPPLYLGLASPGDTSTRYLLQAFDAESRRLVASTTSPATGRVELSDLPAGHGALVLTVRTITARATSDAVSIYVGSPELQQLQRDDMQELFELTPALGAAVGAIATLLVVGAAVAVTLQLRRHVVKQDVKMPCSSSTNKDQDDAADENNPDVIPQSSDKCHISDEEVFEMMPATPKVIFKNLTSPMNLTRRGSFRSTPENEQHLTYVQLCPPGSLYPPAMPLPASVHPVHHVTVQRPPVVYAQVDVMREPTELSSPSSLRRHQPHRRTPTLQSGIQEEVPINHFLTLPRARPRHLTDNAHLSPPTIHAQRQQFGTRPVTDAAFLFPVHRARCSSEDNCSPVLHPPPLEGHNVTLPPRSSCHLPKHDCSTDLVKPTRLLQHMRENMTEASQHHPVQPPVALTLPSQVFHQLPEHNSFSPILLPQPTPQQQDVATTSPSHAENEMVQVSR